MSALRRWLREERGRQNWQAMFRKIRGIREGLEAGNIVVFTSDHEVVLVTFVHGELPAEAED